jgi:hypothetical protein
MKTASTILRALPATILLALVGTAHGQCGGVTATLEAATKGVGDYFGQSVSMSASPSGVGLMVGVPGRDTAAGTNGGAIFSYARINNVWGLLTTITPTSGATGDAFGSAVQSADPYLISGAPGQGVGGAAYIFERFGSTWTQKAMVSGLAGDGVGYAVAINSSWAAVGAPNADITVNGLTDANAGRVFLMRRDAATGNWNSWGSFYMQQASSRNPDDHFGASVAISGQRIMMGIPDWDGYNIQQGATVNNSGAAQIVRFDAALNSFAYDGWFTLPDLMPSDRLGAAVAIDGSYAAVSAPGREIGNAVNVGVVYMYRLENGQWVEDGTLQPVTLSAGAGFGSTLDIAGTRIVVGSSAQHQVHIFKRAGDGQWVQDVRLSDPNGPDSFGESVAIHSNIIAVGDRYDDPQNVTDAGVTYMYDLPDNSADTCVAAIGLSSNATYTACTQNATLDGNAPCGGLQASPDIWFKYTAPMSGILPLDTFGSSFDTVLSVHSGCPGVANNAIACNDDYSIFENGSYIPLQVTQGQVYFIRLAGKGTSRGTVVLHTGVLQPGAGCYANCDGSQVAPILNVGDFTCFLQRFAAGDVYANCDQSTVAPVLNVGDFTCFLQRFAAGCP